MVVEKSSWKDKVDPAFVKIIKYVLQILSEAELPANTGWIALEDYYLKIAEKKGMRGWVKNYEYEYWLDFESDIRKSLIYKKKNTPESESKKHLRDFEKELFEMIKMFPDDSKEYYKKRFRPWLSEKERLEYFGKLKQEEFIKSLCELNRDCFMLELHTVIIELEKMKDSHKPEVLQKKANKQSAFMGKWAGFNNAISLLVFKKSIYDLIKDASNGDETAFFKLLQIDRTVIEFDWAKKMIRKAQLTGNQEFFKNMAKAISTAPLENTRIYSQALLVLLLFWKFGLERLENSELIDILEETGIKVQDDPETFRKFVNREVRPVFQNS